MTQKPSKTIFLFFQKTEIKNIPKIKIPPKNGGEILIKELSPIPTMKEKQRSKNIFALDMIKLDCAGRAGAGQNIRNSRFGVFKFGRNFLLHDQLRFLLLRRRSDLQNLHLF